MIGWGKIIGAFLGFLLTGNLFGILLGVFVGNLFDRGYIRNRLHVRHHRTTGSQTVQLLFFKATFMVMGHIAKADGRVSENEIQVARTIMQRMRLSDSQKQQAINYYRQGKQTDFSLHSILNELARASHNQRLLLQMFVEIQHQAALADGVLSSIKQGRLNQICQTLGVWPKFYQYRTYQDQRSDQRSYRSYQQTQSKRSSLQQAYDLLEIRETASKHEIKRAYRKLMSQHHPDKLIAKGLPKEMIKIATDKTQCISVAYEEICKSRGF